MSQPEFNFPKFFLTSFKVTSWLWVDFTQFSGVSVIYFEHIIDQSAFTCSKLTIETLEQGVKYLQS